MTPELTDRRAWLEIDGNTGLVWVPFDGTAAEAVRAYPGEAWTFERIEGWGVRAATDTAWLVYQTEAEANTAADDIENEQAERLANYEPDDLATREGGRQ